MRSEEAKRDSEFPVLDSQQKDKSHKEGNEKGVVEVEDEVCWTEKPEVAEGSRWVQVARGVQSLPPGKGCCWTLKFAESQSDRKKWPGEAE